MTSVPGTSNNGVYAYGYDTNSDENHANPADANSGALVPVQANQPSNALVGMQQQGELAPYQSTYQNQGGLIPQQAYPYQYTDLSNTNPTTAALNTVASISNTVGVVAQSIAQVRVADREVKKVKIKSDAVKHNANRMLEQEQQKTEQVKAKVDADKLESKEKTTRFQMECDAKVKNAEKELEMKQKELQTQLEIKKLELEFEKAKVMGNIEIAKIEADKDKHIATAQYGSNKQ